MNMSITELQKQAHENSKSKGFWDTPFNMGEKLMLITSEVSEVMEADRTDNYYDPASRYKVGKDMTKNGAHWAFDIVDSDNEAWLNWFRSEVKNSVADEFADIVIRVMDLCEYKEIDLEWHIKQKMRYNATRPHMHGKKY